MVHESFSVLLPNADDFALVTRYLGRFETGLRAGDALHLAGRPPPPSERLHRAFAEHKRRVVR